jgi:uncharacterized protein YkwD
MGEAGLRTAAQVVAARKVRGLSVPELDELALIQRAAGEPHPWARAWVVVGDALAQDATMAKLDAWLGPTHGAERRCAVASATSMAGARALAVVTVDTFADLAALPTHARAGQWLLVEARLRAPAIGGEVLVLGPSGAPRSVPTWSDGGTVRARFAPESRGEFTVQVLADVGSGSRPVLEATVFADVEPPTRTTSRIAPGEELGSARETDDEFLAQMINEARTSAGLSPLGRNRRLDAVAHHHAALMARQSELAHELGEGDPRERLQAAGGEARYTGENVAHASTVRLAHRSIWASPSHRANLLRREYDHFGVAVVHDERGDAWVVELFTGG